MFPNVYELGTSGASLQPNELSVQRTWHIQEATNGGSNVAVTLQHNSSTEGIKYSNTNNYISRYWGSAANTAYFDNSLYSYWDYANISNSYSNTSLSMLYLLMAFNLKVYLPGDKFVNTASVFV